MSVAVSMIITGLAVMWWYLKLENKMFEIDGIEKVKTIVILVLTGALIALGFYTLTVSGERNVLEQTVKTKEAETARQKDTVAFYKAWIARDKLDQREKDAEFNRTMAAKPKYVTQIKYVPTGNNCADLNAIAEEARKNAEGSKL